MKTYMKETRMNQISISEIQRNLHKLDDFDIIEIVDKKRNKVKGYFVDSKYVSFVEELAEKLHQKKNHKSPAGSLHRYANSKLIEQEEGAWQQHVIEKYSK